MKTKSSEATPLMIDYLVAKCMNTLGQKPSRCFDCKYYEERQGRDDAIQYCHHPKMNFEDGSGALRTWASDYETHEQCPITELAPEPYSTDWAQGGPIIEREGITLRAPSSEGIQYRAKDGSPLWRASTPDGVSGNGPTPLIAAMRCYVSSKLGDEVEIPEELK
jgi:hypothetical protein